MANYDIRPLQLRMLRILLAIDETCKKHHLRYGIIAGTLLGAVRHKGFIPWDDDMDICMPRPDYELLIKHSKEWLPAPYEFVCGENDSHYYLPFGKIQDASTTIIEHGHVQYLGGIYVDIFPLDAVPSNPIARRWQYFRYKMIDKGLYFTNRDPYRHGHGPSSWVPLLCHKLFTLPGLQRASHRLLTAYDYDQATLIGDHSEGLKGVMPKEVEGEFAEYEFEGHQVMGLKGYDYYLTKVYGDYMTPPSGEHRFQHNFYYLNLEEPYQEYKNKQA